MTTPLLVIVSGPPCTGKTTLSRRIAEELHLPLVAKDSIKELMFERLGWKDRDWSRQLGQATYDILYYFVEVQLAEGISQIVESNFTPELATPRFLALKGKHNFVPCQVLCYTEGSVLAQRFTQRANSGERHPGHLDHLNYEELQETLLKGRYKPLDVGGTVIEVDTTNFATVNYKALLTSIRSAAPWAGDAR